jgi:branched-chain amino acid aminotransferase
MIVWADGRIVAPDEPVITALDHGLLVGDGLFESVRVDRGVPFELERHLQRLVRGGRVLDLAVDIARVREGIAAVLRATWAPVAPVAPAAPAAPVAPAAPLARLRVTITSGPGPLGSTRGDARPTVTVILAPLRPLPSSAAVAIAEWPRNEHSPLAGVKSTSYAENVLALAAAQSRGADEAVFANTAGQLCEGTGSNVFVGIGGRLVTPPLSAGCLGGVTREILCELVDVVEEPIGIEAFAQADEAFLTSTTRRVQAVTAVDGRPLATCPGPLTAAAAAALAAYAPADLSAR